MNIYLLSPASADTSALPATKSEWSSWQMGVRIFRETPYSPLTPEGCADIILDLEPVESLRVLTLFSNQSSFVITNTRPIHTMAVAIGEAEYPRFENPQNLRLLSS